MREISSINYVITTSCNRMCPDCCINIQHKQRKYVDWHYLTESAKYFKGINRIHITGGEPTIHPNFKDFVPHLREVFGCKLLTLETNGFGVRSYPEIFTYFDIIYMSHYTKNSYLGSSDNGEDIEYLKNYINKTPCKTTIVVGDIVHTSRDVRNNGIICERGLSETAQYEDGLLYPCCTTSGVEGCLGIPLTQRWKEEILKVSLPCKNCWFAL